MKLTRIAILFSGRGSNMMALAKHIARTDVPAEIALTICNRPDAQGIEHARANGLECRVLDHTEFETREAFESALDDMLRAKGIELICAAGFMRLLTAGFVDKWHDRILNIHPSLLPKYRGLDTHARALKDGAQKHGCTVHYIRARMDDGPILVQRAVAVQADDTPDTLAARVLEQEHIAYCQALDMVLGDMVLGGD